ncbi:MAG: hypothetical protein R3C26_12845 [Calditrichia bacterium]
MQFHLSETATCKTTIRETADSTVVESPNLLIAQPQQPDVSAHIGNGFVSPIYGVKHPAPVTIFRKCHKYGISQRYFAVQIGKTAGFRCVFTGFL